MATAFVNFSWYVVGFIARRKYTQYRDCKVLTITNQSAVFSFSEFPMYRRELSIGCISLGEKVSGTRKLTLWSLQRRNTARARQLLETRVNQSSEKRT
jgi:hypothetical protein